MVGLDEREREVDARGDPGRRPHAVLPQVDRVGVDVQRRIRGGEVAGVAPVRGDREPVEQPGRGEQERPRAHRHDPLGLPCRLPQPGDQGVVGGRQARTAATGHQQRADRARLRQRPVGQQPQPALGPHGPRARGDERHPVAVAGHPAGGRHEHLVRAGHVERLDAVEDRDDDVVRGHGLTVAAGRFGVNDMGPTDSAMMQTGPVAAAEVDWSERAGIAERAVVRRHVRRFAGVVPGTRIGRIRWPRRMPAALAPWHYWWQAHLIDCLVDAQRRSPHRGRARTIALAARSMRLRNGGSWVNRYYDDIAWLGLALQRGGDLARGAGPRALAAIHERLHEGWTEDAGGGIWWRRGDDVKNAPANGPAAILLARDGQVEFAAAITDWMAETLVDPDSGLVRDGVHVGSDGTVREVDGRIFTYCQGVYLGACVELAERDGHQRWADRAIAVVDAMTHRLAGPDGVLPDSGGGDGGLFAGITARYLADAAVRRPELSEHASRIVLAGARAAWDGRVEIGGGPVFSADWRRPAPEPRRGLPEADLSVQLSAWMLLESAARVQRCG